ncbi:phosphatidate cytidylyltransferase [Halobacteriovorax sp. JY17]|uniref:phosphatidate cytidylyltransferase n=1 Tax=Halobacteriovorax sp. JY17 TaxID=2014617 RepID=UPI000C48AC87|nr:phosphatidate cytidylyltransferase [Halobacteriovorax sp. JY17]PIK14800.1 MAG: phosphatidate cytidylyltransferase [Halobacteriovorax sp. JY17]
MTQSISELTGFTSLFSEIIIGIYALLVMFTLIFIPWEKMKPSKGMHEIVLRVYSWWAILILATVMFLLPGTIALILIILLTYISLREFLTKLSVTNHFRSTLFFVYLAIPIQYYLAKNGTTYSFNSFIPVYMFFLIPIVNILNGEYEKYLEFNGKVFWATMLIVYGFSNITFLIHQGEIRGYIGEQNLLILLIVFLTQINDVLQFLWGKTIGKHKLSPTISPNKTIEGFLGGAITLSALSFSLSSYLPFDSSLEAAGFGFLLSVFGLLGDLNMSAVKRDLGVKDMDDLIPGHGGILDRLDSLSFTLPFTVHYLLLRGYL